MMKLVVLVLAIAAASAGTIYTASHPGITVGASPFVHTGLPLVHAGAPAITYGANPALQVVSPAVTYAAGQTIHAAAPAVTYAAGQTFHAAAPAITYAAAPAPALVNPAPYRVHTGVRTEVAAEPVEQHGFVVKY